MRPGEFLRAIWPQQGHYCIARPFHPVNEPDKTAWVHKVFDNISDAVSHVLQSQTDEDMYFAIGSLSAPQVWDERKTNYKTGEKGAYAVRTHANMLMHKAFYLDIDVGADPIKKYPTQLDALSALKDFVAQTKLPVPTVVSSGGGLHVYWIIETEMLSSEWLTHAFRLKQLTAAYGLKADPACTSDPARVLRVAGTFNLKDRANPRAVALLKQGLTTPTDAFTRQLSDALTVAGLQAFVAPPPRTGGILGSNMTVEYDGPPAELKDVLVTCAQLRAHLKTRGNIDQSAWYHGILNVVKHVVHEGKSGREVAHHFSQGHPAYSKSETDAKLDQLDGFAPARCETIRAHSPFPDACKGCQFATATGTMNPLIASRRSVQAPAPIIAPALPGAPPTEIPPPPKPYLRLQAGGVAKTGKDQDGNEATEVIYPYDLYPVRRLVNAVACTEQQVWCVDLPRHGKREFILEADSLYDSRKFMVAIAHQGIYPHKAYIGLLQDYMVAYISELQRLVDADQQANHLGWADDHTSFILPDKILKADGSIKQASLSLGAQRASVHVTKRGTLVKQIELMKFYRNPAYVAHQYFVLQGLASVVFYATGHHGMIVNAYGDAGSSKSTALYTAASFWGHPKLYPLNGTNDGATTRGRNERVTTLANLPICVDEVTHMPVKEAQDLAMSITQPGHRIRLQADGVERLAVGSHKSTIMLTTANSSLHSLLSADNAAGTAGSMRVFEISFRPTYIHSKPEADEYLRQLEENYGHIGEIVASWVVRNRAEVDRRIHARMKEVDELVAVQSSERFWSSDVAAISVIAEIARELQVLDYDPVNILRWAINEQFPKMRGTVTEEYTTPLAVLTNYLEQINGNIVVVQRTAQTFGQGSGYMALNKPHGSLLGHFDMSDKVMIILKKPFRDYCLRIGANASRVMQDLHGFAGGPIIPILDAKRTLGAGTEYAKGQSYCFVVNMAHKEITGQIDLKAVGNPGAELSKAAGKLKSV